MNCVVYCFFLCLFLIEILVIEQQQPYFVLILLSISCPKDKDTVTYNILINACSIEGEWQLAQHFLQQLHGKFQKCLTPTKDVGWC